MSNIPPCKNPEFIAAIASLTGGVDVQAARAAEAYLQTQLDPVKSEMENQVEGIAIVIVVIIVFFLIIPLLLYILWISYELGISAGTVVLLVVLFFITAVIILFLIFSSVASTISQILNTATSQIIKLDNPATIGVLINSINGAAAEYLLAIGTPCTFP